MNNPDAVKDIMVATTLNDPDFQKVLTRFMLGSAIVGGFVIYVAIPALWRVAIKPALLWVLT